MTITFEVDNVELAVEKLQEQSVVDSLKTKARITGIEGYSDVQVIPGSYNPLVHAAWIAFSQHRPLVLSPDSFWLTISSGLATHINLNAEELRHCFVDFKDKKYIEIERNEFVKGSSDNNWQGCFPEFSDKIAEYIDKKRDLIVSDFSTTGPVEKAVSELVLMDAMQSYFDYGMKTMCGFPTIALEGTKEDWENIYNRVRTISEFNLEWWTDTLLPVMEKVVATVDGEIDIPFWQSFLKIGGGSGGPYVTGWINTLFPYLIDYKRNYLLLADKYNSWDKKLGQMCGGPGPENFPTGLSKVPFKWYYYSSEFEMEFIGGLVGVTQEYNLSLKPVAGWAVRDTTE